MTKQFKNFKKNAGRTALTLALVGATTVGACAAGKHAVTTANLHMRTGEGTGYKIVETIKQGEQVEVLDNNGSWWKVKHNGTEGYSYRNYLRLVNNKQVVKEVRVSVDDSLMVRTGASTSHKIIGRLHDGARLQVTGQKGNWYEINYKGNVAYVHSGYCKDISSNVNHNQSSNQESNQGTKQSNETVKVNASRLMLRTGASTNHRIMDRLPRGTKLVVVDRLSNGWLKVMTDGKLGYVSGDYTVKINENNNTSESTNEKIDSTVKITAGSLNVRAGSSVAYAKIGYVHSGQELKAVEKASNGWYKVQLSNGDFGWVSGRFADVVNTNENTNKPVVPPVVDNNTKPNTDDKTTTPDQKPGDDTTKPVVPDTKPEDKPVVPDQKPDVKPDDTVKPGEDTTKPEDKPVTPDVKPEDKPSTGEDTTKPVTPDVKPDDKPSIDEPVLIPPTNQAPRIHFENVTLTQGDKFTKDMLNIDSFDLEDGKIPTDKVQMISNVDTNKPGAYTVILKVADKEGYETTEYAVVTVKAKDVKNETPVIDVKANYNMNEGDKFEFSMLGAKATDKEDGDLTSKIKYEGTVDANKAGYYPVTLSVTDSQGKTFSVLMGVNVNHVNQAPVLNASDVTINQGDKFDYSMVKASAHDQEEGDLTSSIRYSGNVDTNKAGTYKVHLEVADNNGGVDPIRIQKDVTVTVKAVNSAPHIAGENVTLTQGDKYSNDMLKIDAIDKEDGVISDNVKYEGNVDTNKPGVYTIKATVTDSKGLSTTESFTITVKAKEVVNNAPVINCVDTYTMSPGDKFDVEMLGATAHDKEDGDLTNKINLTGDVKAELGTYKVTLSVTDAKGLTTTKDVTVKVIKRNEAPVIDVNSTYKLHVGDKFDYSMLGATASDDYDGNVTDRIQYKGNVDTSKAGTYKVSVFAEDSQGWMGQKFVTVVVEAPVVENEAPVLTASDVTLNQGDGFSVFALNINAQDKEDGNLTSKVHIVSNNTDTSKPGTYKVELSVTDSKGVTATKTVTVTVKAKEVETNLVDKLNSDAFQSQVRANMVSLVNNHRVANGLKPYTETQAMNSVADAWSNHMADEGFCDHVDGNGKTSQDLTGETHALENVLMIGATNSTTPQELAKNMFNMWKNSTGHNNAMLNDMQNEMGFGYKATQDEYGNINIYATQDFNINWDAPEAPKPEAPKAPEVKEEVKAETPEVKEEVKAETPAPVVKDEVKAPAKEEVKVEEKTETPAPAVKEEVKTPAKEEVVKDAPKADAPVALVTDATAPVESTTK